MKKDINDVWINVIERKYGIKISNIKNATEDKYIAYLYSFDGEIIGLWNTGEGFPYGIVEVQLLNENYEVKEILGEELVWMENKKIKIKLKSPERIKVFINIVGKFKSDVDIMTDKTIIDAKSIIGIFALDLTSDVYVRIISDDIAERRKFEAEMENFRWDKCVISRFIEDMRKFEV